MVSILVRSDPFSNTCNLTELSETIVAPFTGDFFASYLSLLPSSGDAVVSFGPIDTLLTPAQHYIPTRFYNLFPHPAQDSTEQRKYIAVLSSRYVLSPL